MDIFVFAERLQLHLVHGSPMRDPESVNSPDRRRYLP